MKNITIDEFRALKNGNISTDKFRALNTEMNEQRKKRAEETLNNLMNPISNIAQSTISGMQNRPTMSDILNDFNSKRKVFEEEQKKQATNTLNNISNKTANLLDIAKNTTNNIINDVRQSGAEDLSSYVQRKNQEQAVTNLKTNPTSPLFDYGTFANEKIKQENRQNSRYKSMSEDKKIQQALKLQNNLRTEATPGQKVGYTAGDVINNLTHSVTQEGTNLLKGFLYWQGDIANAFNNKERADLLYKIAGTKDAASQYVYEPAQQELEKYSKLDDTARQVVQGLGQVATKTALSAGGNIVAGGMGLTETGTRLFNDIASNTGMFAGSMAGARDEAISQGATQDQARVYGYLSGLSETASESMFGGFGKLTDAMGISRGIGGLDEKLSYGLRKNISNAFARNLVNLGVSAIGEGTEEVVSGLANAIWKKLTYLPDEDLRKLIEDEKLADSFVVGMLTSAIFQIPEYTSSSLSGTDMSTGQNTKEATANEKLQQQYKNMMDEWKKENPEAYRMFKTTEEYFDKNPILKEGSLIESAEKYGYNPNTVEIQATQRMLDKAGIKVEFSDEINDPNIEGLWTVDNNGNRSIIINPYASKETIFQKVAVHELTHDILNKDIKEAESFKKDILDLISKEKSFTEAKTKIENLYKNITENGKPIYDLTTEEGNKKFNDIVEEELITNAMAEKFGVQEEINKLVSYKPSLARRIYDKVVEFFGKATGNEKLLWKNVQNKFERAFSQEGQFKTNEDRYNIAGINSKTVSTDNTIQNKSLEQRVSGDELLNAQDLIEEVKSAGGKVDDNGYVTVYHQTNQDNANKILKKGKMSAKEDGIFFSTSKKAQQSEGRGNVKLEFKIPAEKLVLDDIFDDNVDVKIPLDNKDQILDVSDYLVNDNNTRYSVNLSNEIQDIEEYERQREQYDNNKTAGFKKLADTFGRGENYWEQNLDGRDKEFVKRFLKNDDKVREKYLKDNNINVEQVYEPIEYRSLMSKDNTVQEFIKKNELTVQKLANDENLKNEYFDLVEKAIQKNYDTSLEEAQNMTKQWKDFFDAQKNKKDTIWALLRYERDFDNIKANKTQQLDNIKTAENERKVLDNSKEFDKYVDDLANTIVSKEKPKLVSEQLTELAQDTFGITDNFNLGAWMTPDGKLLNFNYGGYRSDHRDINSIGYTLDEFLEAGNIRMKPEGSGFELSQEPTEEQYGTLAKYIDSLKDDVYIEIDLPNNKYDTAEYKAGTPTSKIISDLQYYFKNGKFPSKSALADFRYSINRDNSLFNLEGEGTRTKLEKLRTLDFEDKQLTRQERKIMESWRDTNYLEREKKLTDLINNSNLPEERKTELIYNELTSNEDLDGIITEDILNKLENKVTTIVNDFEKEYKEKQEESNKRIREKQQEAKSWAIAKKEADTYDSKTYNLLERLEEKYPTNRNGKRTGKEWYDFANELGQELKKMGKTEQELDKIAKQTWYLYNPGKNRASSNKSAGYENNPVRVFNNSWVKAVKNGYESVNTILPTQAKIENKTIPIEEQQITSQNEEIEPQSNKVLANPEDVNLPEQNQKGRKTLQSIIQSEQTDETTKELARNMYKVDSYTPVSNVETLGEVNKQIRELGEDKLYNAFMGKMETGEKTTLKDIATGERLIQVYSQKGDYEKVNNLIREVAILGTELGQQVQALSLIRRATPEGQLRVLESLVNRANQKENTNVKITPEMTEKILNSKTQTELTNNIEDAKKELAKQLPLNFAEKTRSWRYLSMLGNPKTHIRNIFANIGMSGVQDIKNRLAGMIEDITYAGNKNAERTKTLRFANKDQRNFARQDAKEMENLIDGGGKYEQKTTLESNKRAFDNKVLNKVAEFNTNALDKEDKKFLRWAYQKAMSNYMAANNLSSEQMTGETLQKARNYASKQAQEATFHQFSQFAKTLGTWQNKSKAANLLVSAIVPFKKTPINIAKTGFEYSPAGLIKTTGQAIRDMTKTRSDLRTQLANGDITQEQYNSAITEKVNEGIDNLSKNLTGTGIALLGYVLAKMGVIKAGNDDKEDEYEANRGNQQYSLQIGDYNFSLDWLAPSTIPLFMGAEIEKWVEETQTEDGDVGKNITDFLDSASKMFEPMTDMSVIQGLTNAIKSFESNSVSAIATNLLAKPAANYLGQYIPTALGQVAKSVDPYQRDTTSTQTGIPGVFDKAGKQALSKIPGLSQLLPTKVDVWGNKVKSENYLQNAINPSNVKENKGTATDKELKRLYESTGTNIFPTTFNLTKYYKKDGVEYRLTPEEYNEMKTNYGQTSKNYIDKLIKSSDYKKMTDTQKAKAITEIYTYAKNSNKIRYMQGQGLTEDEKTNVKTIRSMINEGANPVDYFTYRGLTDGMKKESEKNEALLNANFDNTSKQTIYENNTGSDDNFFKSFKNTNPNMNSYLEYKTQDFTADKDSNGKTISNSKKQKVYNYIAQSSFDYPQRLMLTARDYKLQQSEKQYLVDYIVNLDISTEEMVEMLKNCGNNFEIKNDQVYFK